MYLGVFNCWVNFLYCFRICLCFYLRLSICWRVDGVVGEGGGEREGGEGGESESEGESCYDYVDIIDNAVSTSPPTYTY